MLRLTGFFLLVCIVSSRLAAQEVRIIKSIPARSTAAIWTVAFSPDGLQYAAGGDKGVLTIAYNDSQWFRATHQLGNIIRQVSWHPSSPGPLAFATNKYVHILGSEPGRMLTLNDQNGGATALGWNHTGDLLAIADGYGNIHIWNISTKEAVTRIEGTGTEGYTSLDWHPSKDILVASGRQMRIIDTAGNILKEIDAGSNPVTAVRWHPSGSYFASANNYDNGKQQAGRIRLWNESGSPLSTFADIIPAVYNLEWNKEGSRLATVGKALQIWTAEGKLLHNARLSEPFRGLDWHPSSSYLVISSKKGRIHFWTPEARKLPSPVP